MTEISALISHQDGVNKSCLLPANRNTLCACVECAAVQSEEMSGGQEVTKV